MGSVFGNFFRLHRRIDAHSTARKRSHLQLMLFEQVAQLRRAGELLDRIGAQLNPGETQRGDVVNGLAVIFVPSDRRISKMNLTRRWRNRRVKVRQVSWWIQRRSHK